MVDTKKNPILNEEEEKELREGQSLYEMSKSPGWKIIKRWLDNLGYHAWIDPRGISKKEWDWQELNAFHAANNAKEISEMVQKAISRSEYLDKVKNGEVERGRMKI